MCGLSQFTTMCFIGKQSKYGTKLLLYIHAKQSIGRLAENFCLALTHSFLGRLDDFMMILFFLDAIASLESGLKVNT